MAREHADDPRATTVIVFGGKVKKKIFPVPLAPPVRALNRLSLPPSLHAFSYPLLPLLSQATADSAKDYDTRPPPSSRPAPYAWQLNVATGTTTTLPVRPHAVPDNRYGHLGEWREGGRAHTHTPTRTRTHATHTHTTHATHHTPHTRLTHQYCPNPLLLIASFDCADCLVVGVMVGAGAEGQKGGLRKPNGRPQPVMLIFGGR